MNERHRRIIECLKRTHRLKVQEMVDLLGVSDMTIRRDFEFLEQEGHLRRVHGGAELVTTRSFVPTVAARLRTNRPEKEAIVRTALSYVGRDETILLDAGSTTFLLAQQLPADYDLKVVTNSLDIAAETLRLGMNTIILGGVLLPATSSGVGLLAVESLRQLSIEKAFLGASGITVEHGVSNDNLFEVEVKRQMVQSCREITILADSGKLGRQALGSYAGLSDITRIITDWQAPEPLVAELSEHGVHVVIAEK